MNRSPVPIARKELLANLFPLGVPKLWCPILSHFQSARTFDIARIAKHLAQLAPHVRGILTPGSTGEGWQMNDDDIRALLRLLLPMAHHHRMHVLIGILKTSTSEVLRSIEAMDEFLQHPAVVGITVCPPKGEANQGMIEKSLQQILEVGIPTALYQLPQVTGNEMSPETVNRLACAFPNFILLKDTSGLDRVAQSEIDLEGIFMVRGSEKGGYWSWLRPNGGPYDGFLLSSANTFSSSLHSMILASEIGDSDRAKAISEKIESVIGSAFEIVAPHSLGNPFTNANKAIDHCLAFGSLADAVDTPILITGDRLPRELITEVKKILIANHCFPESGYFGIGPRTTS